MSAATCAVLTAVFPILLVLVVLDTRRVRPKFRKGFVYQFSVALGVVTSIYGLVATVLGVQNGGIGPVMDGITWVIFLLAVAAMSVLLLLLVATFDREDKNPTSSFGKLVKRIGEWGAP